MARLPSPLRLLLLATLFWQSFAIKFRLSALRNPEPKCISNPVHDGELVIVSVIVDSEDKSAAAEQQRVDLEVVDSSPKRNVYLSKKGIQGEKRFAVTSHAEGDVLVCFKNYLDWSVGEKQGATMNRIIDLDVDIGADAVDYNAIANQESLSVLETEMRKLEGQLNSLVEELGYLKEREERFSKTNASTNERVQNFAWFIIIALGITGAYQILHLRSFFKQKYLID